MLALVALELYAALGDPMIAALAAAELLLTFVYFVLLDGRSAGSAAAAAGLSIYDRGFWWHERYWKCTADSTSSCSTAPRSRPCVWRALGVRVGRRLFDDGCMLTERALLTIGDHCILNERTVVQCHSQENGAFKSDRVVIGSGVHRSESAPSSTTA